MKKYEQDQNKKKKTFKRMMEYQLELTSEDGIQTPTISSDTSSERMWLDENIIDQVLERREDPPTDEYDGDKNFIDETYHTKSLKEQDEIRLEYIKKGFEERRKARKEKEENGTLKNEDHEPS